MKYLLVNPYHQASHGIQRYCESLNSYSQLGIEMQLLSNDRQLTFPKFRQYVHDYVTGNFGADEVIVEAPEAKAATLLLPRSYRVHVRLHCPLAIAQRFNGSPVHQAAFSDELRVMNKAWAVSSPSYGLLDVLRDEFDTQRCHVFKNPPDPRLRRFVTYERSADVVFLGRFQSLKGTDLLNPILRRLPEGYRVRLIGPGAPQFRVDARVRCRVERIGEITDDRRLEHVARAGVLMLPSRFENCSMVMLEALSVGTPVVAWDVGGNAEVAPQPIVSTAPLEDFDHFASLLRRACEAPEPFVRDIEFQGALNNLQNDFRRGFAAVVEDCMGAAPAAQPRRGPRRYAALRSPVPPPIRLAHADGSADLTPAMRLKEQAPARVFGVTISNEHIEEMWMPVIERLGAEYRFVCRRPLGYMSRFGGGRPVDPKFYAEYDWIAQTDRLLRNIKNFRPNVILFHNGSHPMYREQLERLRSLRIPILFTELGWLPQHDHIYFDHWGCNGSAHLASRSAESLCGRTFDEEAPAPRVSGHTLVITQLDNDTNLITGSPRFKHSLDFVRHVLAELPEDEHVVVKCHPRDGSAARFAQLAGGRVRVCVNESLDELLAGAKAVVGINSTVLIEALKYDCNIYGHGEGILDNKGVLIDCKETPLSAVWTQTLHGSRARRDGILEALNARQVHTKNILAASDEELLSHRGLEPFWEFQTDDFREAARVVAALDKTNAGRSQPKTAANGKGAAKPGPTAQKSPRPARQESTWASATRKARKLKRNPRHFFQESKHPPLQLIGRTLWAVPERPQSAPEPAPEVRPTSTPSKAGPPSAANGHLSNGAKANGQRVRVWAVTKSN